MFKLLTDILDLVFPPRQNELLLRRAGSLEVESLFTLTYHQDFISLSDYRNKTIKAAITENKFHNNKKAAKFLALILNKWLAEQTDNIYIVPIPLGKKRLRDRGHNQVESILESANASYHTNLKRMKETLPQSSLPRDKRLINVNGAFSLTSQQIPNGSIVIIIDDVATTGSTLRAAKECLRQKLPPEQKIICLALTH